ncbi:MAG: hypothetical protein KGJ13_01200 [Patescibacteria group bacterium]|nr:hypothetical protein [Patescibacteria group bacterium]
MITEFAGPPPTAAVWVAQGYESTVGMVMVNCSSCRRHIFLMREPTEATPPDCPNCRAAMANAGQVPQDWNLIKTAYDPEPDD